MKAARFHAPGEPLRIEELPDPQPGRGQVVVQVQACGICGSDAHFWEGHAPVAKTPITLGHEPAGTVETVGEGADGIEPGQRVVVRAGSSCGRCAACRGGQEGLCERSQVLGMHIDGGLAERVVVDAASLLPVPDGVPLEQAAIIGDAVATPYHALVERGGLRPGEDVAVFGCGGLGYHAIQIARLSGAATIIAVDVRPAALERAAAVGADATVNASEERASRRIRELTGGVDLAIECVGRAESIGEAVTSLRRGGRAVVVGMGPEAIALPPPNIFTWSEYALIGSFGSSARTVERLLAMAATGRLDLSRSVTHRLPLDEVNHGLELLRSPESDVVRIVVEPAG